MKNRYFKNSLRTLLGIMIVVFVLSDRVAMGAAPVCFDNWATAARHIEREELVAVKDIRSLADEKIKGELIRIKLCNEAEGYAYRLVMVTPSGHVKKFSVDAKKPVIE